MKTRKVIKLINDERLNAHIKSVKGCDIPQNDYCYAGDFEECFLQALDICAIKDFGYCSGHAKDVCLLEEDHTFCDGYDEDYT